ncbi:hypothetical protein LCGC14_1865910 [marine sediment metagenome]|uniref:Uncharacterized protein n=1 Tax=marine sediment metagenome TaxID=412755 RepID=A0A0F9GUG7_9ZZZZ
MASQINETPILNGLDAVKFSEDIEANESAKASLEESRDVLESYRKIMSNADIE